MFPSTTPGTVVTPVTLIKFVLTPVTLATVTVAPEPTVEFTTGPLKLIRSFSFIDVPGKRVLEEVITLIPVV